MFHYQDPTPPAHLRSKFFHPFGLGRQILNEHPPLPLSNKLWDNNRSVHASERNQTKSKTKTKPSHVTFKLTTGSIVRFSPQKCNDIMKRWLHCLTPKSIGKFLVNNILMFDLA